MLSKMLAFAVGLGAAAAWDGGLSLRHPTPAFAAPAAAALFADKTADGRGVLQEVDVLRGHVQEPVRPDVGDLGAQLQHRRAAEESRLPGEHPLRRGGRHVPH